MNDYELHGCTSDTKDLSDKKKRTPTSNHVKRTATRSLNASKTVK